MDRQTFQQMVTSWQREDDRFECTARVVRAMTHWVRDEEDAAKAWLRAAMMFAPASS